MPVLPGDRAAQAVSDEFAVLDPGVADRMGKNRARIGRGEHLDVSVWENWHRRYRTTCSPGANRPANDNEKPHRRSNIAANKQEQFEILCKQVSVVNDCAEVGRHRRLWMAGDAVASFALKPRVHWASYRSD